MTLVGFALAYPANPSAAAVRMGIDVAVEVFDIFGVSFAVATSAVNVIRKLYPKDRYADAEESGQSSGFGGVL